MSQIGKTVNAAIQKLRLCLIFSTAAADAMQLNSLVDKVAQYQRVPWVFHNPLHMS